MKIGRNEPCPCGSGKKFKNCHGSIVLKNRARKKQQNRIESLEVQRTRQQGKGRPIISSISGTKRSVTVGSQILTSGNWKTFHDFLKDYIRTIFDEVWFANTNSHPVLDLVSAASALDPKQMNDHVVSKAAMNASFETLMELSYSLYLVEHNCGPLDPLIKQRLLHPDQFWGASYELWVAGWMILAGFKIKFENESDQSRSHCEFTATCPKSLRSFSVEVKRRAPGNETEKIRRNLNKALKKQADHQRMIFIEANLNPSPSGKELQRTMGEALDAIRLGEDTPQFKNRDTESSYVFVTNSPVQHVPEGTLNRWAIAEGYKIPDLKLGKGYATLRDLIHARDEHSEVFDLMDTLHKHAQIPVTFDGEIPELLYGETEARLLIGESYLVPDSVGNEVEAELESATIDTSSKKAMGVYRTVTGERLIAHCPVTEDEVTAYRANPDTFFGEVGTTTTQCRDPLDFFDSMLATYSKTPKKRLLEFMEKMPDLDYLRTLSQQELAKVYAERLTETVMRDGRFD